MPDIDTYRTQDCLPSVSGLNASEDCLYMNIVKPAMRSSTRGGFNSGGPSTQQNKLTFIVENSMKINKPIIAISIADRSNMRGFLNTDEMMGLGQMNPGLKDQRLALHWIQENIAAFKVTLWGKSAGATSIAFHLAAFNGRDDGLFRAAIMESGGPVMYGALNTKSFHETMYRQILGELNCTGSLTPLRCLQQVPAESLDIILRRPAYAANFKPSLDRDMLARFGSVQLDQGDFVKVPIIIGCNSDEGTLYTDNSPDYFIPTFDTLGTDHPIGAPYGRYWQQFMAYVGDLIFIAQKRKTCETWARYGLSAFCYRFNAIGATSTWPRGLIYDQNANNWTSRGQYRVPSWPAYTTQSPKNLVFDANVTSYLERDDFRNEGIRLINDYHFLYCQ
ncbi:Alpha/Beta hydrolase protein [Aspergillus pseudoustus]|uniref:Alpha/Beta hydrolase protein n=1 Tax=Aspergillus pseudoustus TaxID=1810923 RepID=A0ABR4KFE2_9EURO